MKKKALIVMVIYFLILGIQYVLPIIDNREITYFIDVGQADAALIECDGHYMLIDGGNKGDSNTIYSVLKKAVLRQPFCLFKQLLRYIELDLGLVCYR